MIKHSTISKLPYIAFLGIVFFLIPYEGNAQYTTTKVRSKHQIYTDSLKSIDYEYTFPILGHKAYKKGFDLPYPAGIMGNYMWMEQDIIINNLQLGYQSDKHDIPLTDVDFIEFGTNTNNSYSVNVRPDLWILPFLNVYGIVGVGNTHTEVNLVAPIELQSIVEQKITTGGLGVMAAGGIGPIWFSVDANYTWNKPELLNEPTTVQVIGVRFGHSFTFKEKPERNIAVWIGGMSVKMGATTNGQVKLIDAIPDNVWNKRDEVVSDYWSWYDNEASVAQKVVADRILTPIVDGLEAADGESIIRYGMEKQVKQQWNGILGMQYQLNKNWMLRSEAGIIGNRKSLLLSLNYRFLL
jgi:opacity protein-like surface antigen